MAQKNQLPGTRSDAISPGVTSSGSPKPDIMARVNELPRHIIVIGGSAGCLEALPPLLSRLSTDAPASFLLALHLSHKTEDLACLLSTMTGLRVKEAEEKETVTSGTLHIAPAGYHLMVEPDASLSLSLEARVNHARPSIDVLFDTASDVFASRLTAIVLSGMSADGSNGLALVNKRGGCTIIQSPESAVFSHMPESALHAVPSASLILSPDDIGRLLVDRLSEKEICA